MSMECGLYLAPSTIPGAGMGMYAGNRSYKVGDVLTDSDLVIPVFELEWHNGQRPYEFLWGEYTWNPELFPGMNREVEDIGALEACSPGMGAAVNCRPTLVNAKDSWSALKLGMSGVTSQSPGAGAFTPYYGRQFVAAADIVPGSEFYVQYGENYFTSRDYHDVPLKANYRKADTFLKKFQELEESLPQHQNVLDSLWKLLRNEWPFKSKTMHALPSNASNIDKILQSGGTARMEYNQTIKSLEWLEENGQCIDNIRDGVSSIEHAGRGAFATRNIRKGHLVAPAPLIHIPNRNILTMYDSKVNSRENTLDRNPDRPHHKQLMLNYCFGHSDSTLLLCPYGLLTGLINHSQEKPNTKIDWSKQQRHPEWIEQHHREWGKTEHSGLSFDFVALRDIAEGEEILIDYGDEWETAWQEHLASFETPPRPPTYMPAFEMNARSDLKIRTIDESDYEQHEGIHTYCRKTRVEQALGGKLQREGEVKDGSEPCHPCRIRFRNEDNTYIAELFERDLEVHESGMWDIEIDTVTHVLFDVPRDTFFFDDAFYSRDHHQIWSFRHDMRIPDDMFPEGWRGGTFKEWEVDAGVHVGPTVEKAKDDAGHEMYSVEHADCGIYFAPSTIPGAGMGMYAGNRFYKAGETLTDSDLVIPVFELKWHNDYSKYPFLWKEYVWNPTMFTGMEQEVPDPKAIHACSPGMGAAVNCRPTLVNAEDAESTYTISMSGVSSQSPGAGAFTPYHGRQFVAVNDVLPGTELYVQYGEKYFNSRSAYDTVPLAPDYKKADKLLNKTLGLWARLEGRGLAANLLDTLWELISSKWPYNSRAMYALPANLADVESILQTGGTARKDYNDTFRSLAWLEEHGQCMDNIRDGVSTMQHAGRGAFASRFIPAGGLVAPVPLIHIPNRTIFTVYDALPGQMDKVQERNVERPVHKQLMLNYCFGHRESTLLLCPYGLLTGLINHSHRHPNAKVVWSKQLRHPEWHEMEHKTWGKTKHSGLSFDFVALRDIEEGEEILIDYGEEWESAWQAHRAQFEAPPRGPDYMPAFEMNDRVDLRIRTMDEVDYEFHEGIMTYCRKTMVEHALGVKLDVPVEVKDDEEGCYSCRVRYRNHDNSYIAEIFDRDYTMHPSKYWEIETDTVRRVLFDVPRDMFYFQDNFYGRDHHQVWTFRHDMRIPDALFPQAWKDRGES